MCERLRHGGVTAVGSRPSCGGHGSSLLVLGGWRLALETQAYRPFGGAVGTDWWCTGFIAQQREATDMKIVVIGGAGRIGSKVIKNLRERGHDAFAADLNTGVNTITGEGLDSALADAQVVVDLANSPSFEDAAVLEFFQTSGRNLLKAEVNAGVEHHVALSIVGADRLPDSGYMRAKVAQEQLIEAAGQPYTIIRSTQFFEFLRGIADSATDGDTVTVPTAQLQPIAAQDVAAAVTEAAMSDPINGVIEIAGPTAIGFPNLIRDVLNADHDPRTVVGDPHARYFGTELTDTSLTPGPDARLGPTTFTEWLAVNHR
jgi:uncharacterized protein YbjT (DUF2867 family)